MISIKSVSRQMFETFFFYKSHIAINTKYFQYNEYTLYSRRLLVTLYRFVKCHPILASLINEYGYKINTSVIVYLPSYCALSVLGNFSKSAL